MNYKFTKKEIEEINRILKIEAVEANSLYIWKLISPNINKPLVFSIYCDLQDNEANDTVISAQTQHGYYEIHNIQNFMVFEPDEIIFCAKEANKLSCLIIGANGSCSLFANVSEEILTADLTTLSPSKLLAAMQLGVVEVAYNKG